MTCFETVSILFYWTGFYRVGGEQRPATQTECRLAVTIAMLSCWSFAARKATCLFLTPIWIQIGGQR